MKQADITSKVSYGSNLLNRCLIFRVLPEIYGGIAQLGEHLLCKQGVVGSIPSTSTKKPNQNVLGKSGLVWSFRDLG